MKKRMLFYLIVIPFLFLVFLSFLGFWQATHPAKITTTVTPKDLGWQFEDVTLETEDNIKLSSWFVPSDDKKSDKAVILLHGYPADKGDLLDWAHFLKQNYHLLFLDFRYFGKSEGSHTFLGTNETKDVLSAINFLKEKQINNIGLMGFSFGGSIGLLTLPQTTDVKAVVADSPFANLDLMGKVYYGNIPVWHQVLMGLSKLWGKLIYGIDTRDAAVDEKIKSTKTPILIIASPEDDVVSIENTNKLKDSLKTNLNSRVEILDRSKHGSLSGENYQKLIQDFFNKYL